MSVRHAGSIALAVIVVASMVHLAALYPMLPERMATHFDFQGDADGWSSKQAFIALMICIQLLVAVGFILGANFLQRISPSMVNLPHKEYWLAPPRRRYTLEIIGGWLVWMGVATSLFLIALTHNVCEANLWPDPHLQNSFWFFLGFYLLVVLAGVTFLIIHFNRVPKDSFQ